MRIYTVALLLIAIAGLGASEADCFQSPRQVFMVSAERTLQVGDVSCGSEVHCDAPASAANRGAVVLQAEEPEYWFPGEKYIVHGLGWLLLLGVCLGVIKRIRHYLSPIGRARRVVGAFLRSETPGDRLHEVAKALRCILDIPRHVTIAEYCQSNQDSLMVNELLLLLENARFASKADFDMIRRIQSALRDAGVLYLKNRLEEAY